jgi:tRNA (guanosine-2'-O-)-methyltransferase
MNEEDILREFGAERVVECLTPMLTDGRIARIEEVLGRRIGGVQVAVEAPTDPHNAIAVIRTAEAMGLYRMHLIATEFRKKRRTTCGSSRWVDLQSHECIEDFVQGMEDVLLVGACPRGKGSLEEVPIDRPICLLFGNEYRGLSDMARKACGYTFKIPMYGMVESYNLSVSAALTMQSVVGRVRRTVTGDMSPEEWERARSLYYLRTIGLDTARLVLQKEALQKG